MEQGPCHLERRVLCQRRAAGRQAAGTASFGTAAHLADQAGLPNAGSAGDYQDATAVAGARRRLAAQTVQRRLRGSERAVPFQ